MSHVYIRGRVWWMKYTGIDGQPRRETTGCTDHVAATQALANRLREVELVRVGALPTDPKLARIHIDHARRDYIAHLAVHGRDAKYLDNVEAAIESFQGSGVGAVGSITTERVSRWLESIDGKGKTKNNLRACLSAFCGWMVTKGWLVTNPVLRVARFRESDSVRRRALSVIELESLVRNSPRDRALAYLVLATTGLRAGELSQLRWENLSADRLQIRVPASVAKSGQAEAVAVYSQVARLLEDSRPNDGRLVRSVPTRDQWRADFRQAGIELFNSRGAATLHSLRHTMATGMLAANISPKLVQTMMRHKSLSLTTGVYADAALLPAHQAAREAPWVSELVTSFPPSSMTR